MILNNRQAAAARDEMQDIKDLLKTESPRRPVLAFRHRELAEELSQYEALSSRSITAFPVRSLADVPLALIQARIARGWTQADLAREVGVSEQMVQKDEAGGYGKASLARLVTIAIRLGVEFDGILHLNNQPGPKRILPRATLRPEHKS